ncbi:HAD domain-containing protein [Streptomyces sp. NPDC056144]|uniref:HAD domain-containing protein n=1 Tax=unclassified Streptomyces TaxID=2593676 RepID=UPI0035DCCA69
MNGSPQRPLLFLDVDGPLIPFGARSQPYPTYTHGVVLGASGNPLLSRLNPAHGPRLAALPCDLVWATTWTIDANELIAPRLGLPPLDVVLWDGTSADGELEESDARSGLHWKTRTLVAWAAGRPFVWVDDEITGVDRDWVTAHHPSPTLLHRVDPRQGLPDDDYAALHAWLR